MSDKKIRIQGIADFSSIKREVNGLNKTIEDAFGDGVQIFDEDSIGIMKREVVTAFGKMRNEISKLSKESKELQKQFKTSTGDAKKQEELSKKQVENARKRVLAEKELFRLKQSQNTLETGLTPEQQKAIAALNQRRQNKARRQTGRAIGHVGHMFSGAVSDLPGVSAAASVGSGAIRGGQAASAAGMGPLAIGGLAVLGAAAVTAAVAISRMASGFEVYKQGLGDLLKLSGMGVKDLAHDSRTVDGARELGFDKLQVLAMQSSMVSAFGKGSGAENSNRMLNTLTASRGLGMDPSTIFGGAEQLRSVGGTESAQKHIATMLEKAFTSGMDKTQATHFLNASVGLLTEINQGGVTNNSALLGLLAELSAKGNMSPEQAARSISGMSGAIAGSTGEANAFFQTAAARAGLGGGTLLGTTFATRQGLGGVDLEALRNQIGDTESGRMAIKAIEEMGLGSAGFTKEYAGAILGEINRRSDTGTKSGRAASLGFTGSMFGTKSAPEIGKIMALLEKMSKGEGISKDNQKFLSDLGKDPQDVWRSDVLKSLDEIAISTSASQAGLKNAQFDLGEASAPIFNKLTDALSSLDITITRLLHFLQNPLEGIKNSLFGGTSAADEHRASSNERLHSMTGMTFNKSGGLRVDSGFKGKPLSAQEQLEAKAIYDELNNKPKSIFNPAGGKVIQAPDNSLDLSGVNKAITGESTNAEMLNEQKKTNNLLERIARPGGAPRSGRELTRP